MGGDGRAGGRRPPSGRHGALYGRLSRRWGTPPGDAGPGVGSAVRVTRAPSADGVLAEDPQLKHYKFFEDHEHPVQGNIPFSHGPGFRLSEDAHEVGRSNLLGEHNHYVYTEILDMSDEELARQVAEGVI